MRPCAHDGYAIASAALRLQGVPYRSGGSDLRGFDCSGLVQWAFARNGRALPREVREQFLVGREIDSDNVKPGDLLFFDTASNGASHVGIALDHETFVHAPRTNGVVRIERYTSTYWSRRYLGALIDIHVRLSPSDRLVVQIANREGGFTPEVGQPVHVGWPASAGQVFNE